MLGLEVLGIRLVNPGESPVVLLRERDGTRVLPIWVGSMEAAAIAVKLDEDVEPPRPMTHDLLASVLVKLVGQVRGTARITKMVEGTFYACLVCDDLEIDCRPSDAIALALRLQWAIECPESLMDEVGVEVEQSSADEVERFKEFLDNVNPDDFEG